MSRDTPIDVALRMSDDDLSRLCAIPGAAWGESDREDWYTSRYEYQYSRRSLGEGRLFPDEEPQWDWKRAYWVSDRRADLVLVTSYLRAKNEPFEVLWDMRAQSATGTACAYVVLTNYETY